MKHDEKPLANPGYALFQLSKALTTHSGHPDSATREHAARRILDWSAVFTGMLNNKLSVGSQVIFFLALLPQPMIVDFLRWAEEYLDRRPETFRNRFRPALISLVLAAQGHSLDSDIALQNGARRFWAGQRAVIAFFWMCELAFWFFSWRMFRLPLFRGPESLSGL
jgi:hypothetical protein